jgi:hypothetical protein
MCTHLQVEPGSADRERFFNSEFLALLYAAAPSMLIGGDFNCVLQPADTMSPFTSSSALSEIVRGLALSDVWSQDPQRRTFTHYSPSGATRIDRFYLTQNLLGLKRVSKSSPQLSRITIQSSSVFLLIMRGCGGDVASGRRIPSW